MNARRGGRRRKQNGNLPPVAGNGAADSPVTAGDAAPAADQDTPPVADPAPDNAAVDSPAVASAKAPAAEREPTGPGELLAAAREKLGLAPREAADALNLPLRFLQAMEANNFDKLPAAAFTRGYLRGYARLVEIDAELVLDRYYAVVGDVTDPYFVERQLSAQRQKRDLVHRHPGAVLMAGTVFVVLLGALVLWLVWPTDGPPPVPGQQAAGVTPLPAATQPAPDDSRNSIAQRTASIAAAAAGAAVAADTGPLAAAGGRADASTEAAAADSAGADNASADPQADDPASRVAVLPTAAAPDSVPAGTDRGIAAADTSGADAPAALAPAALEAFQVRVERLATADGRRVVVHAVDPALPGAEVAQVRLEFVEDCWVEAEDGTGQQIYGDLNRTGDTLVLDVQPPVRLLLGYAPAANLFFNNQPVSLVPHTRNNVATLVLGQ